MKQHEASPDGTAEIIRYEYEKPPRNAMNYPFSKSSKSKLVDN